MTLLSDASRAANEVEQRQAAAGPSFQSTAAGALDTGFIDPAAQPVLTDFASSLGADLRDAGPATLTALRNEFTLYSFAGVFFPLPFETRDYHGSMCEFLSMWGRTDIPGGSTNFGWKRLCLQVSRDCGKSTKGTKATSLWQVLQSPGYNARLAIFNASEGNVTGWIRHIKRIVEKSREFQMLWPDVLPPGVSLEDQRKGIGIPKGWLWNNFELEFNRTKVWTEPSISGYSVMASVASKHFDWIIKDDLIGEKQAYSDIEIARVKDWLHSSRYLESPAEKGNELVIYTRWHANDPYAYLRRTWPDDYVVFDQMMLCEDDNGTEFSALPTKWSVPELHNMRKAKPTYFYAQIQNRPRAGEDTSFNDEWLRFASFFPDDEGGRVAIEPQHYDPRITGLDNPDDPPPPMAPLWSLDKGLLWDPAPSEERDKRKDEHARNGKVWAGLDAWGRLFVFEARGTRNDPIIEMRDSISKSIEWGCDKAAVEEVNFSKTYKHWARYVQEHEFPKSWISFIPQKEERRSKDARIGDLIPAFKLGFIYLVRGPATSQLVSEFRDYPYGLTRDLLDALAMWRQLLSRPLTTGEMVSLRERVNYRTTTRGYDRVNWQ